MNNSSGTISPKQKVLFSALLEAARGMDYHIIIVGPDEKNDIEYILIGKPEKLAVARRRIKKTKKQTYLIPNKD